MSEFHGINLNRSLASYVFGAWSSSFLFGVISVQTHLYYQKFPKDPPYAQLLVGLLWVMQGVEVGISSYAVYRTFASAGGALQLLVQPWYLSYYGTHGVLVAGFVQSFFALRYWIAFEMQKRRTGFIRTDSVLNHIALYGVATGAVTATVVTIQLLLFTAANMLEPILFFGMPLGGIYIATFLANLHTRSSLRTIASQSDTGVMELSDMSTSLPITDVPPTSVVLNIMHTRD
ncbi:hypothetical protein DL93DRAFT_2227022 [Clavulina sp. PMI_390]|nr:hypothetical protein DL93DRAFT_2227022 [Clavulina sp. PMI_390]